MAPKTTPPQQPKGKGDAPAAASLYPEGTELFVWTPKDGGEDIVFPKSTTVVKPGEAFRFFFRLNKLKGDMVGQFVFMMDTAGVPESMQERAAFLPDEEVMELISAWTGELRGRGES